jgi:hypothetical protein
MFTSDQIKEFINNNHVIIEVSVNDSDRVPLRIRIPEEREEDDTQSPPLKKRRTTLTPVEEVLDEEDSPKPRMARQTMCPWFTNFLLFGFTVITGCMCHEYLA